MKLIKLTLDNFKGIEHFELVSNGNSITVYGDNAAGKTTLADAQAWLFFGRDSRFTPKFSPKRKGSNGEDIHNIKCMVTGVYKLDDGTDVTFSKTLSEVWKGKRGSEKVYSGDTCSYYIDGVPKSEKEYNEFIASLVRPEVMIILTSPLYFPEKLDKQNRREVLISMSGGFSEWDIIENTPRLAPLKDKLRMPNAISQFYTVDEYLQICKSDHKAVNKELSDIPGRIDENKKKLSTEKIDVKALTGRRNYLYSEKCKLSAMISSALANRTSGIHEQIAKLKTDMQTARAKAMEENSDKNTETRKKISEAEKRLYEIQSMVMQTYEEEKAARSEIERLKKLRDEKINEFKRISSDNFTSQSICPTCGQTIPKEKLEEAKAAFNLDKAKKLEKIQLFGEKNCSKEMIAELEEKAAKAKADHIKHSHEEDKVQLELENLRKAITDFVFDDTEYIREISELEEKAACLENNTEAHNKEVNENLASIEHELEDIDRKIISYEQDKEIGERISELEQLERELGEKLSEAEEGISLCEEFSRTKISLLSDKINGLFDSVKFRLFYPQKNGTLADDCEVMIPTESGNLVPFPSANNAARINAGLEIIAAYSKFKKLSMPVFVDNAESITKINDHGLQIIRLVVSENDKTLRTEEF